MDLLFNLEPTAWSRNFDDEEVDELEFVEPEPIQFKTFGDAKSPISGSVLLVAVKPASACLLHAQFPSKTKLASLILPEIESKRKPIPSKDSHSDPNLNEKVCELFVDATEPSRLLLISHYEIPAERANEAAKVVLENIKVDEFVVFDTILDWKFNATSAERVAPPFLRKLETDATREGSPQANDCPFLESPNLIDAFGAALITRRQMQKQKGRVYVSVESSRLLDIDTIMAFESGLAKVSKSQVQVATASYKKMLSSMISRRPSSLFM